MNINSKQSAESLPVGQALSNESLPTHPTHLDWDQRSISYDNLDWVNRDVLLGAMLDALDGLSLARTLDLGTGTGKVLKAIKEKHPHAECWGIDNNEAMLSRVVDREKYTIKLADAENLAEVPDDSFDLITARMVFHHIHNHLRAMQAAKRKLKSGGMMMICEGNPPSTRVKKWYTKMFAYKEKRKTITEIDLIDLFTGAHFSNITTRVVIMKNCSLNNWLENSGLPEENIEAIKEMHYNASKEIKEDYNMIFRDNDCFMDWKFSITFGKKE